MKYFSMFSGIGGFEYGIEKATDGKWECVGYSEIDKHAIAVYSHRFPGQRNYGDATRIDPSELPGFDMLCGGFPCQAFSVAGKREGFGDTRGTLFFEIARILEAKRPPYCFLENVKGLLNHDGGKTFGVIIEALGSLGYDVQWFLLNSKFHGVPQNRERVFIVGSLGGVRKPQILPLGESAEEISGVSGKEGRIDYVVPNDKKDYRVVSENGIAPSVQARSDTHKVYDCYNRKLHADGIAGALKAEGVGETSIGTAIVMNTITQAFGRIGHSKEEMCMSKAIMEAEKDVKSVAYRTRSYCGQDGRIEERKDDVANQLTTVTKDSMVKEKKPVPVNPEKVHPCIDANYWKGQSNQKRMIDDKNTARCLDSNMWKGVTPEHYFDKCQRNVVIGAKRAPLKFMNRNQKNIEGDHSCTVDGANTGGVMLHDGRDNRSCLRSGRTPEVGYEGYSIRRLTPTECERLQGFPDGWTEFGYSDKYKAKSDEKGYYSELPIYDTIPHEHDDSCDKYCDRESDVVVVGHKKIYVDSEHTYAISDTQRYKMLGNAVTTNVIEAIVRSWVKNCV